MFHNLFIIASLGTRLEYNATVSVNQKSIFPAEMKNFGVSERKSLKKRSRHLQTRIVRSENFAKFALPFHVFKSN